jgi:hypothetical protein
MPFVSRQTHKTGGMGQMRRFGPGRKSGRMDPESDANNLIGGSGPSPMDYVSTFMVFKENVYASLIDCAQRVSAPAEGAGHSDVSSWITSELGWNVRRPQVQAPRSRSRDASLLGPCRLKDGAPPLEVQAQTRGSRTLLCLTRAWTRQFTLKPGETTGRSSSSPALSLLAPGKSPRDR